MVLVHGGWGDHEIWGQLAPLLARHHKVITYDRRGHSASERPPGPRRIKDDDDEDLAGLIAHYQAQKLKGPNGDDPAPVPSR